MRKTLDLLTWALVIAAVPVVFYLSSAPDVESTLGIPACAGRPHSGPCRLCTHKGKGSLPGVIDAYNVRFMPPVTGDPAGKAGL